MYSYYRFNRRYINYVNVLHHITGNLEVFKSITLPHFNSVLNFHVLTMHWWNWNPTLVVWVARIFGNCHKHIRSVNGSSNLAIKVYNVDLYIETDHVSRLFLSMYFCKDILTCSWGDRVSNQQQFLHKTLELRSHVAMLLLPQKGWDTKRKLQKITENSKGVTLPET